MRVIDCSKNDRVICSKRLYEVQILLQINFTNLDDSKNPMYWHVCNFVIIAANEAITDTIQVVWFNQPIYAPFCCICPFRLSRFNKILPSWEDLLLVDHSKACEYEDWNTMGQATSFAPQPKDYYCWYRCDMLRSKPLPRVHHNTLWATKW